MQKLFNTADEQSNRINTDLEKADRSTDNPRVGASVVNIPRAAMSMASGGIGDAFGNPIPYSSLVAAQPQAPTVIPSRSQRYSLEPDISMAGGKMNVGVKFRDNQSDNLSLFKEAALKGIDPNGKTREQIYSELAGKTSIDGSNLSDEQKLQGMALATKLYGMRGMKDGLPSVYKEMASGKSIEQIEDSLRYSGQSKAMNGDFRNAAQSILINTPEAVSQKAMDYIDDNLASGNIEGAKTQLKRLARKEAGVEEARSVSGRERTIQLLDEIQGDLNTLESSGINTNIFTGTGEEIARKAGTVQNPEARRVATKIAAAIQSYRKSMSGAAFSVPESEEYKTMFPDIGRTGNFNTANINALKEVFGGDLDSFYALSMGDDQYNRLFKGGQAGQVSQGNMPTPEQASQAAAQGYTGYDTETGQWVK